MSSTRHDPSHRRAILGSVTRLHDAGGEARGRRPSLSIIVPAKNEAESLPQLVREIAGAFRPKVGGYATGWPIEAYEIVVVDDGSTDETPEVLRALRVDYPELMPVALAKNVGQSAATAAGFRAARHDFVAILDADLQNDPADLATLWDALPGHDAALGWRVKREDVWTKRVVSRWANRVRNAVLGQSIRDTGCSVRVFPRDAALRIPMFHGVHRFLGPLLLREGLDIVQVPVTHRPRPHGESHYGFRNRSWKVVVDLIGVAWLMRRAVGYEVAIPASAAIPATNLGAAFAPGDCRGDDQGVLTDDAAHRRTEDLARDRVHRAGDLHGEVPDSVDRQRAEEGFGGAGRVLVAEHRRRDDPSMLRRI